jgi:hypothetical protein
MVGLTVLAVLMLSYGTIKLM